MTCGVPAGYLASPVRFRTRTSLGVGAVGDDLSFGGHSQAPKFAIFVWTLIGILLDLIGLASRFLYPAENNKIAQKRLESQ